MVDKCEPNSYHTRIKSICKEIEDILGGFCLFGKIEVGKSASFAGNGHELPVLDIKYLGPKATGRPYFA